MKQKNNFKETEIGMIPKEQKSLNESMNVLLSILEDVRKETEEDQKEKVYVWSEHYSNWIDIWKYFDEHLRRENFINSCVGFRLIQLNKELLWFWLECTSGAYDNANRTLRYVLESFLKAYYVDKEQLHANMNNKLAFLEKIDNAKFSGGNLIKRLDVNGKYKGQIKNLYRDLNKFVHPSYKESQKIFENGAIGSKITFSYDKESFEECVELTDRVIDTIVFLLMNFSNEVVEKIKDDKIFLKSIMGVENSLVRQYIQEAGNKNDKK